MRTPTKVPAHSVAWTIPDALLVLLGAQLLSFLWVGAVIGVAYDGEIPDPLSIVDLVVLNVGLWVGYGVGPLIVSRRKGDGPGEDFGAKISAIDLPLGIALGVFVQLGALWLLYWPILRVVDGDPSEAARELVGRVDSFGGWVLLIFSVVIMAPLVEELFFRGLLLRSLQRRLGPAPAIIISAVLFGLAHRQLLPLPGLILFGVVAAGLVIWTGRLGPAWALHVGFNATTLVVLGLG